MLKIKNLTAALTDQYLIDNINLEINPGEIHALMGPKRSGKSLFVHSVIGSQHLFFKSGTIHYKKKSITNKSIEERSRLGIFASFQYPPIVDGVSNFRLVNMMLQSKKDSRTVNELESEYKSLCNKLGLSSDHGSKIVNHVIMTSSECKKNELLQMILLDPDLVILDEIDSEVNGEEIELLATTIKEFLSDKSKSAVIVTHNKKLLDILEPTHVHIMVDGEIKEQGTTDLYKRIIEDGYPQFS